MNIEIERRFLVEGNDWRKFAGDGQKLKQAYLTSSINNWTIRVRIIEDKEGFLTLKKKADGIANNEFEYSIPIQDAIELINLSKYKIIKTRYQLKINTQNWVVDIFDGSNSSLKIAEIELNSEYDEIQVPSWCGQEITGIKSLSNASLAKTPISQLSVKNRIKETEP